MEGYIIGLLLALSATVALLVGRTMQPKSDALKKSANWWKEEVESLRTEVKRYRAKAAYYQKGAVPSELGNVQDPAALVEGIIDNLPANYKALISPLKGEIVAQVKQNPELVKYAPALIQKFLGQKQQENGGGENGQATEVL